VCLCRSTAYILTACPNDCSSVAPCKQVNIFFVLLSVLIFAAVFDINQHPYWFRDTVVASIVSLLAALAICWATGTTKLAALAALFLFLLNTNLEWFFGLYRVRLLGSFGWISVHVAGCNTRVCGVFFAPWVNQTGPHAWCSHAWCTVLFRFPSLGR